MTTLEEIAEEFLIRQGCQRMCCNDPECNGVGDFFEDVQPKDLIEFAKWMQERMYSEGDLREAYFSAIKSTGEGWNGEYANGNNPNIEEKFTEGFEEWFKQFKKK